MSGAMQVGSAVISGSSNTVGIGILMNVQTPRLARSATNTRAHGVWGGPAGDRASWGDCGENIHTRIADNIRERR